MKNSFKLMGVIFIVVVVFMLSGCSQQEKEAVYEREGGTKAYVTSNKKQVLLSNPKTIVYYVGGLTNEYLDAAKDACSKMSATSKGIDITYKVKKVSTDKFIMQTYAKSDGNNGYNRH